MVSVSPVVLVASTNTRKGKKKSNGGKNPFPAADIPYTNITWERPHTKKRANDN